MSSDSDKDFWNLTETERSEHCKSNVIKFAEYKIVEYLGGGSFGRAYLATKKGEPDKKYVLKKILLRQPGGRVGSKIEDMHLEIAVLDQISKYGCFKDLLCYREHFIDCSDRENIYMIIVTDAFENSITLDKFIDQTVLDIPERIDEELQILDEEKSNLENKIEEIKDNVDDYEDYLESGGLDSVEQLEKKLQKHSEELFKINRKIDILSEQIDEESNYAPLSHNVLLKIIHNLLKALYHLHSIGIAHRDIKPANILINPSTYAVQIIDFGLGCTGIIRCIAAGTIAYSSPEVLNSWQFKVLPLADMMRADMFSLGVVFYRLANGTFPYGKADSLTYIKDFYNEHYKTSKIFSMYNENKHPFDAKINDFIESILMERRPNPQEAILSVENLIKEYNDLVEKRKQKSSKPVTPDTPSIIIDGSPIKYTPGILSFPSPTKSIQEGGSNKNNKKVYKTPRKWSKEYCKRTSCDRMGFSQKSSCRPYKNCYK